ncbi:heat shock protein 27-like [Nymphalis io]|uniref:heat shock protein 27-like n=1 Tax=Inachis io TaxID=171585 RepID=UPI0021678456|nr:heat shock protein 27-like [Nymphalis io]
MILCPLLNINLLPKFLPLIKQTRNIRPIIKIGKDKFQLCIDVHQFKKDEIRVKARPEYVIIEGKQERKTKRGCIVRQFVRKFKLPEGCNPQKIKSELSKDGFLTITAPRNLCDINLPCETVVTIKSTSKNAEPSSLMEDKPVTTTPSDKKKH